MLKKLCKITHWTGSTKQIVIKPVTYVRWLYIYFLCIRPEVYPQINESVMCIIVLFIYSYNHKLGMLIGHDVQNLNLYRETKQMTQASVSDI